jgi:hypothetical protein
MSNRKPEMENGKLANGRNEPIAPAICRFFISGFLLPVVHSRKSSTPGGKHP